MVGSYNCLRLDNKYVFQVEVYEEENDNTKFFEIGDKKYPFETVRVEQLTKLISHEGRFKDSDILNIWMINTRKYGLNPIYTEDDIEKLGGKLMEPEQSFVNYFPDVPNAKDVKIHIVAVITNTTAATGQKRYADSESVNTEPKRKKDTPTLESLIVDLGEKILLGRPPELYPIRNIAGRFHKRDMPISGRKYVDMLLDVETTDTGGELIDNLKNENNACYLLYAVSGAGKTRAIFDMSMNENGIYVVYVKCRPSSEISNWDHELPIDLNFAQLVASIGSAFGSCNDNNSAREEAKRLIILEFTARILYLIFLKKKFPGITPRDYLLSQLNSGQECIASIRNELRLFECNFDDLASIIMSALRYLKVELPGQKSLIFAIDESNVASKKLFSGHFLNINQRPCGLLTPMIEILRLFEISTVIAGTSFTLKQGSDIQSCIGKGNKAKYIINFNTIDSKDVEAYIMRYLDLSGCEIDEIEDSKYLVGRPCLMARLITEIINAEKGSQENKQTVLEHAVNKTVQYIKNGMIGHLEEIVNEAYEKEDFWNAKLREILMTLFINCWFFDGYVSKSKIDEHSAKLVDCGIASLKSDKDEKFWQVKEPLAIEVVKIVLHSRYNKLTEPLIEELRRSVYNSDTSKGIMWQYFVIGRLLDFKNKTVFDFVNEIYENQSHLPEWTKEAIIDIESYGNFQMFSRIDKTLKDDVDVIEKFLYSFKYVFVPGQYMRPDGVYIGKISLYSYWTLLISAKFFTKKLSGADIVNDKNSTDWSLMYHQKDGKVRCTNLKKKFDDTNNDFTHCGSLRIHYILPGLAQELTSNQSNQSNRGGCYTENNDVIMYIDESLLERYFPAEYVSPLREILTHN